MHQCARWTGTPYGTFPLPESCRVATITVVDVSSVARVTLLASSKSSTVIGRLAQCGAIRVAAIFQRLDRSARGSACSRHQPQNHNVGAQVGVDRLNAFRRQPGLAAAGGHAQASIGMSVRPDKVVLTKPLGPHRRSVVAVKAIEGDGSSWHALEIGLRCRAICCDRFSVRIRDTVYTSSA